MFLWLGATLLEILCRYGSSSVCRPSKLCKQKVLALALGCYTLFSTGQARVVYSLNVVCQLNITNTNFEYLARWHRKVKACLSRSFLKVLEHMHRLRTFLILWYRLQVGETVASLGITGYHLGSQFILPLSLRPSGQYDWPPFILLGFILYTSEARV